MAERTSSGESTRDKPEAPQLVPLPSVVDLIRHPDRNALAIWYARQIAAGAIAVYGLLSTGSVWVKAQLELIPAVDMPRLHIVWSSATAVPWETDSRLAGPSWDELCVGSADVRCDPPPDEA